MNTTTTTTSVPAPTTEIGDLMDALTGFHPALDRVVSAIGDLLGADLTADESQSVVAALGAFDGGNVATLLGLTVRQISDPDTNRALANLPTGRKQTLRRLGAEYAAAADDSTPRDTAAKISAVIEGV